jgi:hypothetical protein
MSSWKPEVQVAGEGDKWHKNGLVFATEQEAYDNAKDLMGRWTAVTAYRAAPSDETPNYRWVDGKLEPITT